MELESPINNIHGTKISVKKVANPNPNIIVHDNGPQKATLSQGVDPSTQVQMLASGGAAAAVPKQRRGQSLKDLAKGGE